MGKVKTVRLDTGKRVLQVHDVDPAGRLRAMCWVSSEAFAQKYRSKTCAICPRPGQEESGLHGHCRYYAVGGP